MRVAPITAESLGSRAFRKEYNLRQAYVAGSMFRGISSVRLVTQMARAGYLSFFGSGGLRVEEIEANVRRIQQELPLGAPYGVNLLCRPMEPDAEVELASMLIDLHVPVIEAAAFMRITPGVALFRVRGLSRCGDGEVRPHHRVLAKLSHPDVAAQFLRPIPRRLLDSLVLAGRLRPEQADLANEVPAADDLCVEADSGGHTDLGAALTLLPAIKAVRDGIARTFPPAAAVRVGLAGGLGTPEAIASAFVLGADFVMTGSVNQCTVEADTSDTVKDLLQSIDVRDTAYAPAGDRFENPGRIQVVRKGVRFSGQAARLQELWQQYGSLEELEADTRRTLENDYFGRSIEEVYREVVEHHARARPDWIARAEQDPRFKMTLVFRWYFFHTNRLARQGQRESRAQYQIHCGPALGAFNRWAKGTELESWRNRRVDEIGRRLMSAAADHLTHWQQVNSSAAGAASLHATSENLRTADVI